MPKFEFKWTEEMWLKTTITAVDEEVAKAKFWDGDFDYQPEMYGNEIQDGIDIEELEEDDLA